MFTIIGSGFGLYGYLPALIDGLAETVMLPERYGSKLLARPELYKYFDAVSWVCDQETALATADGVVIAVRPRDQVETALECLRFNGLKKLVLEKPLAPDPASAISLYEALLRSGRNFRIGYTFRHTGWFAACKSVQSIESGQHDLLIAWRFNAHHFANNLEDWKRYNSTGGGVIRFYGIHLIALLAELGYRDVVVSETLGVNLDQPQEWRAVFSGGRLPVCRIIVDSRCNEACFSLKISGAGHNVLLADLKDPFETGDTLDSNSAGDRRIPVLTELCRTLQMEGLFVYQLYQDINVLWEKIERATSFRRL